MAFSPKIINFARSKLGQKKS
jgi:hypothetical protein